ncbi:MAG: hypothetical protein RI894_1000 [Bacteroidota bacterium]
MIFFNQFSTGHDYADNPTHRLCAVCVLVFFYFTKTETRRLSRYRFGSYNVIRVYLRKSYEKRVCVGICAILAVSISKKRFYSFQTISNQFHF